jgi:hypothetical protein
MPKSAEDILLEILITRRQLQDQLSWQVPAMMLLAEAFILLVALGGSSDVGKIIASGLGIIVASVAILSVDRLKNGEMFDTNILNKIVMKISNDDFTRKSGAVATVTTMNADVEEGKTIYRAPGATGDDVVIDQTIHRTVIGDEYHTKRANYYTSRENSGFRMFFVHYTGNIGWITVYTFFLMAFIVILVLACIQERHDDKNYI